MTDPTKIPTDTDQILDVAIIGAGIAGVYSGYRMMKDWESSDYLKGLMAQGQHDKPKIRIFDADDRVGGRLWSHRFPDAGDLIAEMGGQGFSSLMHNVYQLAKSELKQDVEVVDCPCFNNHLFQNLRGSAFVSDALTDPANFISVGGAQGSSAPIRYFVEEDEKKDPGDLVVERFLERVPEAKPAYDAVIAALTSGEGDPVQKALPLMTKLWEVLRTAKVEAADGSERFATTCETGIWNWLYGEFSSEAYQLNVDSSFTISFDRNYNLYDIMVGYFAVLFAYYTDTAFWTVKDGYDQVPKSMAKAFVDAGGAISLKSRAMSVDVVQHDGHDLVVLEVAEDGAPPQRVYARSVVLTLPKLGLARLAQNGGPLKTAKFFGMLDTVETIPASKFFLMYKQAWWSNAMPEGVTKSFGFATTDLPMKATYYIGEDKKAERALLLASLSDASNTGFWNAMQDEAVVTQQAVDLDVSPYMIEQITHQLEHLHGGRISGGIPVPVDQAFLDWMKYPYEGAWHLWKPNVKSWEIMPEIRKPVAGLDLFICGEAYSTLQGWAEGSVNTAERMLEDHFQLPRARWLDAGYDVGP